MTTQEFSDAFDTLVNSYSSGTSVTFDEYEKSLFLTQSQREIVIAYYNGNAGPTFEGTEEYRRYFEPLVLQDEITEAEDVKTILNRFMSYKYKLQSNVLFIIFEAVDFTKDSTGCKNNLEIPVQPVTHDDYHKVKNNPFRGPNERRVLRLDSNLLEDSNQSVELITKYPISTYKYRYLKKPSPIVLTDFDNDLSIEGVSTVSECEIHESLHDMILKRAVQIALGSKGIGQEKQQQQ